MKGIQEKLKEVTTNYLKETKENIELEKYRVI